MKLRRSVATALMVCLLVHPAFCDEIVLLNGERVSGDIADREGVAANPLDRDLISILDEDRSIAEDLKRYPLFEIDYIVLEDESGRRVLDIAGSKAETKTQPIGPAPTRGTRDRDREGEGIALTILGLGCAGLGALVKFGDEKLTVTEHDIDYDEKSYNATNYVLIVGGGTIALAGIIILAGNSTDSGSTIGMSINDDGTPCLSYQISF